MTKLQKVYIICGVSGVGKTWVCEQLKDKFHYVPHDQYIDHKTMHADVVFKESKHAEKPIITECPFAERPLKEYLESRGIKVVPIFVVEKPEIVMARYLKRENKPLPKAAITRATTIMDRINEWGAKYGSSKDVLQYLKTLDE